MNLHAPRSDTCANWISAHGNHTRQGILLIECAVYMSLMSVVLGLAFMAFYRCRDFSIGLHRNADDIVCALNVGERWRQDIRLATGQIRLEFSGDDQVLHIPQEQGEVLYRHAGGELHRRGGADKPWVKRLPWVKSSQMEPDVRAHITSWRWELELMQSRKHARVRPLFTFQAVPMNVRTP